MNILEKISSNVSTLRSDKIEYVFCDLAETQIFGSIKNLFGTFKYNPWIFSLMGSILVGLSGIFPLLVIPVEDGANFKVGANANRLRILLSFAVGGLLGDVFLHLLPEAWDNGFKSGGRAQSSLFIGVWVLIGMLVFIIVEKLSSSLESNDNSKIFTENGTGSRQTSFKNPKGSVGKKLRSNNNFIISNNNNNNSNNRDKKSSFTKSEEKKQHLISGYLNLLANTIDNFTHGLAIGGSFTISLKMGLLSTFAILVHELPHEIGDFAILLKSGFSRWDAAKAQFCTAFAGIVGSMFAVLCGSTDSIKSQTSWIHPFTAGGFLHIALVSVLPELLHEENNSESCKQLGFLVFGIGIMAFLILFFG